MQIKEGGACELSKYANRRVAVLHILLNLELP
jgi:hypothetical protein